MKKLILSILAVAGISTVAMADVTTVKTLYSGDDRNITWETPLYFGGENFADVNVGDFIYIEFSATSDVIELKSDATWLPGSRYTWLGEGVDSYTNYITASGLAALKTNGLELCGANFTVKSVSVRNDGFQMPTGAVWGGYFWVDNWNTLEIRKNAFDEYNGEKYMVIHLSDDNGENTNYIMNVLTEWENPDAVVASNEKGNIIKNTREAVIDLSDVDLPKMLEGKDRLMVQGHPEGGNPFNITGLSFRQDNSTVVNNFEDAGSSVDVINLQGVKVRAGVASSEALEGLPQGLYIVGGKKVLILSAPGTAR